MFNIAVYADSKQVAEQIRGVVISHLKGQKQPFRLATHDNFEGMKRCIDENDNDIYIMDFSDADKAAFLAERIRRINNVSAIIVVNASIKELKKYLYIRPSAYVEKSSDFEELSDSLNRVKEDANIKNRYFVFKCEGEIIRIPYDKISFFESNARKVTLSEVSGKSKYNFMAKLDEIQTRLPESFLRCHQSYLVNMCHISRLDKNTHSFVLFNSNEVFISRRLYSDVVKKYEKFVSERRHNTEFNIKMT